MKNVSFYIKNLNDSESFSYIENMCEKLSDKDTNISIFFDSVGKHLHDLNVAYFPAVNLWNFCGEIFAYNIEDAIVCSNVANKVSVNYIFGVEEISSDKLFILLTTLNNCKVYAYSRSDQKEVKRLLNKEVEVL